MEKDYREISMAEIISDRKVGKIERRQKINEALACAATLALTIALTTMLFYGATA
jgi:hypothetical protein